MRKLYGRHTTAIKLLPEVATKFTEENHRDGLPKRITGLQTFGLQTKDGELVAVAIMGNPRTRQKERKYSSELVRLTFKKGVQVVGGASKLLKYIMREGNFYDFFTYQDTSGGATDLYSHAGMRLVSQNKRKEYLVKNGYTLETANRRQKFSMAYAVQYGPDRIIGTNLGQDTGKTNKELFLESGYHIETTSGDRVYEWFNPEYQHYVYRITSIEDDGKYYIGAHSPLKTNLDEYMGSGGNKFTNWKKDLQAKYGEDVQIFNKEILEYYPTRGEAFEAEKKLIGDKYKTDPLCKNATSGGRGSSRRQHNGKGVKLGVNDLASQHPELASQFDPKRNHPLTPKDLHIGTPTKVWWKCEHGHEWESETRKRVQGFGCPTCAGQRVDSGKTDLQTLYPDIARQIAPNQDVDPSQIAARSHKKLLWQCDEYEDHVWETSVDNRVRGRGCPYCSGNKVLAGFNDLATKKPELLPWWSDDNTIKPTEISPNSNKKVWWKCPEGHPFDMSPAQKSTSGCPICANKRVLVRYNDFASQNPVLMEEWSDKNTIDPETITSASTKKAIWECSEGHEWERPVRTRVRHNSPCPICKNN